MPRHETINVDKNTGDRHGKLWFVWSRVLMSGKYIARKIRTTTTSLAPRTVVWVEVEKRWVEARVVTFAFAVLQVKTAA
jgi:hypothetical protein